MRTVEPVDFVPQSTGSYCVVVGNLNALRCLVSDRYSVLLATPFANRVARYSRYCHESVDMPSPTRDPTGFIEALLIVGRALANRRAVLFYDGDADLQCISENREALSEHFRFLMPQHETVLNFLDKLRFSELAEKHFLRVPKSAVLRSGDEVGVLNSLRFPAILKPMSRVGWLDTESVWDLTRGAKGISVASVEDIDRVLSTWNDSVPDFLVQEIVSGPESNILSYHAYIDEKGGCLGEYTGRKHRTYPSEFGRSSFIEVDCNPEILEQGRRVARELMLVGAIKLDFKRDARDGLCYLFEVNSRFSIWNYPAMIAGVNLLEICCRDLLNLEPPATARTVRTTTWIDGSLDRHALNLGYIRYGFAILPLLFRRNSTFNIWSWKDPMPILASTVHKLAERFSRMFRKFRRVWQ